MQRKDYSGDALRRLEAPVGHIPTELEQAFLTDLITAIKLRNSFGDVAWVPYADPLCTDDIRSEAHFPNVDFMGNGPRFAFVVRPVDAAGATTENFYGVPLVLSDRVSLEKSGLLERKITAFRQGNGHPPTDKLTGIVAEMHRRKHGSQPVRANQDLLVNLTIGDILKAYETEGENPLKYAEVQRVTAIIPANSAYTTEGVGYVVQRGHTPQEHMCFGYGVGETFYRGRPILRQIDSGPRLIDINAQGSDAYFSVVSVSSLKTDDLVGDVKVGNMVVIAMPLVGDPPEPSYKPASSDRGELPTTMSLDLAALKTGRTTGSSSRLVPGRLDPTRTVGILDVQLLVSQPNDLPQYFNGRSSGQARS